MSIERKTSDRRKLRAGMVFVLVVAGTAMIGWGGLAAWQAVTANDGSSFATGGVHMQNVATISYPTARHRSPALSRSPLETAARSLPSPAPLRDSQHRWARCRSPTPEPCRHLCPQLGSAVTSGAGSTLCGDLTLTITDSTGASVYNGALTNLGTTPNLFKATGSPSTTWNQNDTNTFTFNLALPGSTSTDQDSTCTADFTWTQTQA